MSVEPAADPSPAPEPPPGDPQVSVHEFHREIATELFSHVLALLGRNDRTCAENDRMIHAAHASRFHWDFGGTPINHALGEWQCARVHTAMKQTESALHHAWRYLEMAESYGLGAFHLAHAHLTVAAAFAGTKAEEAARQLELAKELFPHVEDEEEKQLLHREAGALEAPAGDAAAATAQSGVS